MECRLRWRLRLVALALSSSHFEHHSPFLSSSSPGLVGYTKRRCRLSLTARRQTVHPYLVSGGPFVSAITVVLIGRWQNPSHPVHRESHKSRDRAPCREPFTSPLRSSNISPRRILLFFRHPRLKGDLVRAPRTSSLNAEIYTRVCQPCEQLHGET